MTITPPSSPRSTPRNPGDMVRIYHPENTPSGVDPDDCSALTTWEAYELVWQPKGFALLEESAPSAPLAAPPASATATKE